jgi:predicted lysophospholipase L1 biosynthesis ABC-type transport system permease subunit
MGAPASVINGLALAFDRRRPGVPVRSTVATLLVAVVVAVGATTFAANLDRLAKSPARWGSPWDLALNFTSSDVERAARVLAADDALDAVGRWDSGATVVDGAYTRAFAVDPLRGELGFTIVEGRQPGPGEAVLGPDTADRSSLAIGDDVVITRPDGSGEKATLRVVGIGLFPEIDDGDFEDAVGLTAEDFAAHAAIPDLFEASQVVVRVAPETSLSGIEDRLQRRFGGAVDNSHPVRPGAVGNLVGIRSIPRLLVLFTVLLVLAALAHAMRSGAERQVTDFATLRAIGMTRPQLWRCLLAESVALTAAALLAGVPLGIAAGRLVWSSVARSIEIVPEPWLPAAALAALVVGSLIASALAAAVGRRPLRPLAAIIRQG